MHNSYQSIEINAAILTVSDTRTMENDFSGQAIQTSLREKNYAIVDYQIVKDELTDITSRIKSWCENPSINAIIITGGTGFSPRDTTYEAVSNLLEKEMQGFGELFRSLSFDEIGPNAMFSRAIAGCCSSTAIYSLPGSVNAVTLAMNKLILPTVQHFVWELHRI